MVSLKSERKTDTAMAAPEGPNYPLSLYITDDMIATLGLSGCEIGEEKMLHAKVKVTALSKSENENGPGYSSVTLTLTEGEVEGAPKDYAKTLFGE
jgi:hypothetical protein